MGHGGKRAGAGRKPNPLKNVRVGAATAEKILRELGHEKEIAKLYRECGDPRLKVQILFRLRECTQKLANRWSTPGAKSRWISATTPVLTSRNVSANYSSAQLAEVLRRKLMLVEQT